MRRIKTLSNAAELKNQHETLLRNCENVVRVIEQRVFAGNCAECNTDLYASKGDHEARCKTCGTTYEVLKWRQHAIKAAKYYVGTATDLSRKLAAPEYGYHITADQIRKWGTRLIGGQPKLVRQNPTHDQHGTPLAPTYRLDHVQQLANNRKPLDGTQVA
jgi:DNA-directed RNA polymerase subunit RPC12/RpoP